ncbi:MAG: metallophosphoesterase family protein [Limisphaerales bacterium]
MPAHLYPTTRRKFLAGAGTTMAAVATGNLLADDPKVDPDLWALLSDTHLLSAESIERHYGSQRAAREKRASTVSVNFDRAAAQVNAMPQNPAGLILNGDCVHVGGREEYDQLADKFALIESPPIHVTMGNHDHRGDFARAFGEGSRAGGRRLLENRHVSLVRSRRANFVLLDSLTMKTPDRPVKGPGILGAEQLDWLESVLDSEADKPAIVVMHHNIDPSAEYEQRAGTKQLLLESAGPVQKIAGLEDTDRLLDLLHAKPQVKAVVTGHRHQGRIFQWRKLHFIHLPAVGYTLDPKETEAWLQLRLRDSGAEVKLRTLDPKHARSGKRIELKWS